jgi:hypothetical protein
MSSSLINLRRPVTNDIESIQKIASEYENNPLPDNFESAAVVEKSGELVSFGVLRSDLEAIFYCSGRDRDKAESLILMMARAIEEAKLMGHNSLYVFAQDENFAKILEKRFNFKRIKTIPLILDLD